MSNWLKQTLARWCETFKSVKEVDMTRPVRTASSPSPNRNILEDSHNLSIKDGAPIKSKKPSKSGSKLAMKAKKLVKKLKKDQKSKKHKAAAWPLRQRKKPEQYCVESNENREAKRSSSSASSDKATSNDGSIIDVDTAKPDAIDLTNNNDISCNKPVRAKLQGDTRKDLEFLFLNTVNITFKLPGAIPTIESLFMQWDKKTKDSIYKVYNSAIAKDVEKLNNYYVKLDNTCVYVLLMCRQEEQEATINASNLDVRNWVEYACNIAETATKKASTQHQKNAALESQKDVPKGASQLLVTTEST
ncbi:hypothetical protein PHLGIDRAFT_14991 [Phlebiopsis gigantea 11061_1 CR5-6]|uniref:Uncharacterized protein n=1 Tax=Phlebiopsis gigantea (strain 11061_1 CR5-6) TaxID=745531 RepID=A0A0C3S7L9_PHLG1|nr:hypothetical protein PHLGIDRAFT_14991 [Phlebiopsis gigantea 11061_1 CR5-6]